MRWNPNIPDTVNQNHDNPSHRLFLGVGWLIWCLCLFLFLARSVIRGRNQKTETGQRHVPCNEIKKKQNNNNDGFGFRKKMMMMMMS